MCGSYPRRRARTESPGAEVEDDEQDTVRFKCGRGGQAERGRFCAELQGAEELGPRPARAKRARPGGSGHAEGAGPWESARPPRAEPSAGAKREATSRGGGGPAAPRGGG